jgi:branched-chain amino acid transport system ATP-binding protein
VLKIENLVVSYGGVAPVLRDISMEVPDGRIVTLLGANGAGKSTTLKAISGLLRPLSGAITLDGSPLHTMRTDTIVKAGVSHVPEGRQAFPGLTVDENLKMGAYTSFRARAVAQRMEIVFALFPRLAERRAQLAGTLSGGEQQMLAIGRGLMIQPKILMLDEPSLGLAPLLVSAIFQMIREVRRRGVTILLVEQNARMALDTADRAYVLELGEIVLEGPARDVRQNPAVKSAYLGCV